MPCYGCYAGIHNVDEPTWMCTNCKEMLVTYNVVCSICQHRVEKNTHSRDHPRYCQTCFRCNLSCNKGTAWPMHPPRWSTTMWDKSYEEQLDEFLKKRQKQKEREAKITRVREDNRPPKNNPMLSRDMFGTGK